MSKNPLLESSPLPHHAIQFNLLKAEHFLPALDEAIVRARAIIAGIKKAQGTFSEVIEPLESAGEKVDWVAIVFYNLLGTESTDQLQKLAQEIGPKLAEYSSDLLLDPELFAQVQKVHAQREELELTREQRQLLDNTYSDFVRNGALLNPEGKSRLRAIDQRLSQLGPAFSENVLKATNAFELFLNTKEELAGLPDRVLEEAKQSADGKGRASDYLFTLQYPSVGPFLKFSEHRPSREKLVRALNSRAFRDAHDNQKIVLEMVQLRHERALLLGYSSHANFVLEKRMAESTENVRAFLERLLSSTYHAAIREVKEVQDFAQKLHGPKPLQVWDFSFYSEKLKEERFSFHEEELRPYFKLENVVTGIFQIAERLYGLDFAESKQYPVYHPDVQVFEVHQTKHGQREFMGLFYADFFPRPSKRDGAWMTNFYEQGRFGGEVRRPHVSIVCNFTKTTATRPSLLSLGEVQTLFHEFGHALHSLLSRCEYRATSGTNVYWDFVELPSQIMENWTHEKEALDLFARHYETGNTIPKELVDKINQSKQFLAGYNSLRQLNFCYLDMAWYGQDPALISDVQTFELGVTDKTTVLPRVEGSNVSCAFGHIFGGGYSAGYYSYKWAEVLDADAFEFFKEKGIFSREVAERFENNILSRGGTEHPAELYRRFRGHDPDPDALLRRDGLL